MRSPQQVAELFKVVVEKVEDIRAIQAKDSASPSAVSIDAK
jgi:hypothetical protein